MKAGQLQKCFLEWIKTIAKTSSGDVIAIDGKTIRRLFYKTDEKSAIHVVSAWANENRIVLGQEKVDEKSNEITAIPELLSALEIQNCIITIDEDGMPAIHSESDTRHWNGWIRSKIGRA